MLVVGPASACSGTPSTCVSAASASSATGAGDLVGAPAPARASSRRPPRRRRRRRGGGVGLLGRLTRHGALGIRLGPRSRLVLLVLGADDLFLGLDLRRRQRDLLGDRHRRLGHHLRPHPLDAELRRHLAIVAQAQHPHAIAQLDLGQPLALVVEDVERHLRRRVHDDLGGAALRTFLLDAAQHVDRGALGRAHMPHAAAMRTGDEAGLGERGTQPLAAHLHQAEMADMADLDARAVVLQRLLQAALDHARCASSTPCR